MEINAQLRRGLQFHPTHLNFYFVLGVEFQESLDQTDQMFKPGWKDIFRMNQNELESEIRKVYRDATLDPRRKAYLVQNLMTRSDLLELFSDCYIIFILTQKLDHDI